MDTEVLIAGAGPTGLVLAIELVRRGVDVRIVDKVESYPTSSRGDALVPRTLTVFDDLGILDEVLAAGRAKYPVQTYRDGVLSHRRERITHTGQRPNMWLLGQARTEQLLRGRLAALGVRVQLGTAVTGLSQDAQAVTVRLNGEEIRAAYLVGADGGKSFVRHVLGVPFPGTTDETVRMLICDVEIDGLDTTCAHWFAQGLALMPVSGQPPLFQLRAPLGADAPQTTHSGVQALLDSRCGAGEVRLRDLRWSTVLRSNLRIAERFRVGRVFLAGDAVHVHPPTGSYGLNTGVEDAYNLGWKLATALRDSECEALLDSYHQERHRVASQIHTMITGLTRTYASGGEVPPELDLSYRHSPLSVDERAKPGTLRAGDRAPDALVQARDGRPTRLFELFHGTHATVLAFGQESADPPNWPGEVRTYSVLPPGFGAEFTDHEGQAFGAYDVLPATQVLVRPDGYVAAIRSVRSSVSSNTIRPSRS